MKKIIILLILIIVSINVFPENEILKKLEPGLNKDKIEISEFSDGSPVSLINFFMALSFVIGLIFFSTYLFKRLTGIKNSGLRGQAVNMSIISNLPLGDKKFLLIVEIQGKHHFIGVTPSSISYMSELSLDIDEMKQVDEKDEFRSILDKAKELLTGNKK